jgi:hypothetical protein
MANYITWEENSKAFTADGFDLDEFRATGLNESQAVAIWKLETISAVLLEHRKTMKTCVETTGCRIFLICADI